MKKILAVLSILFLMSGCDNNMKSSTDSLTCNSTTTANGITTKTNYNIEYKDDDIKYVTITYDYSQDATTANNNEMDGVNADTDGLDEKNDGNNDQSLGSEDVIDGVVGDAIDGTVDGVRETILDIAGIKNRYESQLSVYDNMEGFSYKVDMDNENEYRIIYEIDMSKINDLDLTMFNVTRNLSDVRDNYESLGYTCK